MLINIRDDDANFFTKVEDLVEAYGELLEHTITIGVVPYLHGSFFKMLEGNDHNNVKMERLSTYEECLNLADFEKYHEIHPIGKNKSIIKYLKNGNFEIMLHGIEHRFYPFGAEFKTSEITLNRIIQSKKYLELLFERKVDYFIPPSNSISYKNFDLVAQAGLGLVCSANPIFENKLQKIKFFLSKYKGYEILRKAFGNEFSKWYLKVEGKEIISSVTFSMGMTKDSFLKKYENKIIEKGYVSIATHYHALQSDPLYKEEFHLLISYLKSEYNGKLVGVKDIVEYVKTR